MAQTAAKLLSRISKLEARMVPKVCPKYVFVTLSEDPQHALAKGERIVHDHYRQRGLLIEARERITTDPKDLGRRCEPEGYLLDIIQEIHSQCAYRGQPGGCNVCFGTPAAGC